MKSRNLSFVLLPAATLLLTAPAFAAEPCDGDAWFCDEQRAGSSEPAPSAAPEAKASKWLAAALPKGGLIGYDPNLHTIKEIERLTDSLGKVGIKLAPQADNPIDLLWQDRPAPSSAPVVPHGPELSGRSAAEKIAEVQETLKREKADAVLLTLLDSIAWLFNIRGGDIGHSPLALAFALGLRASEVALSRFRRGVVTRQKPDGSLVTHKLPLHDAPHGYQIFNDKEDDCVKVVLKP